MDYAVFKTGGKQYRVKPGDTLDVEKLPVTVGSVAEFPEVLVVSDGGDTRVGAPYVEGARVLAEVKSQLPGQEGNRLQVQGKNPLPAYERPSPGIHQAAGPGNPGRITGSR